MTYNAVAMTRMTGGFQPINTDAGCGNQAIYGYYQLNPTMANNAVVTSSANVYGAWRTIFYTGVKQTGFPTTVGASTGNTNRTSETKALAATTGD